MIVITKTIERKIYIQEESLVAFANRNNYDFNKLMEDIENDTLDIDYLADFEDETTIDYKMTRD
jgi:hypothetical protein